MSKSQFSEEKSYGPRIPHFRVMEPLQRSGQGYRMQCLRRRLLVFHHGSLLKKSHFLQYYVSDNEDWCFTSLWDDAEQGAARVRAGCCNYTGTISSQTGTAHGVSLVLLVETIRMS